MSKRSTGRQSSQLTLFAEDFPASQSVSQAGGEDNPTLAGSGRSSSVAYATYDPDTYSWRTSQGSLLEPGSLEKYSETWSRAGMMRNGTVYQRQPLAPPTFVIGSSLWRTPQEANATQGPKSPENFREAMRTGKNQITLTDQVRMWPTPTNKGNYNRAGLSPKRGNGLETAVRMWPTPRSSPNENRTTKRTPSQIMGKHGRYLAAEVGGTLNPTWVEWLMGFPPGWTVLEHWETRSSRRSRNGSVGKSSPSTGKHTFPVDSDTK